MPSCVGHASNNDPEYDPTYAVDNPPVKVPTPMSDLFFDADHSSCLLQDFRGFAAGYSQEMLVEKAAHFLEMLRGLVINCSRSVPGLHRTVINEQLVILSYPANPGDPYTAWTEERHGRVWQASISWCEMRDRLRKQ